MDLGGATRLLLPEVSLLLLSMLRWAALARGVSRGGPSGGGKPAQQQQGVLLLRASKATLGTAAFQQDVFEQVDIWPSCHCMRTCNFCPGNQFHAVIETRGFILEF